MVLLWCLVLGLGDFPDAPPAPLTPSNQALPSVNMHWLYLSLAILSEVAGTTCMKLSAGFTRFTPSVLMWLFYAVCFCFLTLALKKVDLSVAYAIWSGVGTALIATVGVLYFREPATILKVVGLVAIIGGVVALNMSGGTR